MDSLTAWPDYAVVITIAVAGLAVVALLWWLIVLFTRFTAQKAADEARVPADVRVSGQPLMSKEEAGFYNVLKLAVQDEYFLLAQVPLWCLIEIGGGTTRARQRFLAQIALKRVEFVLVHPGTLTAVKVIELDDSAGESPQRQSRNRLVDETLRAAGIDVVRLKRSGSYTIGDLAGALDLEVPE